MKDVVRLAAVTVLIATLGLAACAKHDSSTTQTTTTDTTQSAGATPAGDATAAADATPPAEVTPAGAASAGSATSAPADEATPSGGSTSAAASGAGAPHTFIDIPVYPGSTEKKDSALTASSNGGSVAMHVYSSKDQTTKVVDWYKGHLPHDWQNSVLSSGGKTVATFASEGSDGDQSIIVTSQDDHTTNMQLTTKHGK